MVVLVGQLAIDKGAEKRQDSSITLEEGHLII
jgi:hypothetical protein